MVAGDLVNTASRMQSAAEPGNVLVDEATRTAADAAVAFEDAGDHELKGKAEPVRLWRALRVVANRGGEGRSSGLEAPFVGRERELRIVKDIFHASAEDGRAHIVLVTGSAGLGKSRLSWEFEKYLDGLALTAWWHRGRCPSYGEGVAYWALAEMVRGRSGILENDEADAALATLRRRSSGTFRSRATASGCTHGSPSSSVSRTRASSATTSSPPGVSSSSPSPTKSRRSSSSRTFSGPTRGFSTSSSTSSSGRGPSRSSYSASRDRSSPRNGRRSGRRRAVRSPRSRSSRSPTRRWRSCSRASSPASEELQRPRSAAEPRAFRSTRSRPSEC